jgi:MFS transporter, SP family, sugar:H+ symporter
MGFLSKTEVAPAAVAKGSAASTPSAQTPLSNTPASQSIASGIHGHAAPVPLTASNEPMLTFLAVLLGAIASMGGFIFGYESGQISGMSLSTITRSRCLQVLTGE